MTAPAVPAEAVAEFLTALRATLATGPGVGEAALFTAVTRAESALTSLLATRVGEVQLVALAAWLRERTPWA